MNRDEAKYELLMHGSGTQSESGEPVAYNDGFPGMLRPYKGLRESNFHRVMEALLTVGEALYAAESADRDLVASLWSMCSSMRRWALDSDGMLQSNKLVTDEDTLRLSRWINIVESTAHGLLHGCPPYLQIERYCEYVSELGHGHNAEFFVPLMIQYLDDPAIADPTGVVKALGSLGAVAASALPSLRLRRGESLPTTVVLNLKC